jgi:hypothetical protein
MPASNAEYILVGHQLNQPAFLAVSDEEPCAGSSLTLTSTAYPGINVSYNWLFNNGTNA